MIQIRPTHDGTWTVYRDGRAIMVGLTRTQAEQCGAALAQQD